MLPILAPILAQLAANGMGMLAGAIQAKGKAVIEDKLGIKIPDDADKLTPELLQQLKIKEMEHEEFLINTQLEKAKLDIQAEADASKEVTSRWEADMASDNKLSKNVRPGVLIYLTLAITLFAILSIWGLSVDEAYVTLIGQLLMMVYGAYFVGRSVEKGLEMYHKTKRSQNEHE